MNYLMIPFFALLIILFCKSLRGNAGMKRIRECMCVIWCITLLFSLLGTVISFHLYHYELLHPVSYSLVAILVLYTVLTAIFVLISPSGYRSFFQKRDRSQEDLLYAEYRFNHSLEMLRRFFLSLLLVVPILYYLYQWIKDKLPNPPSLEEPFLIGGLFFTSFVILFPISVRQSIFWLQQLQKRPDEFELRLLEEEYQSVKYSVNNHRI